MPRASIGRSLRVKGSASSVGCVIFGVVALSLSVTIGHAAKRPNVVVVVTDDQGYGDMSGHGNPWLQTPQLDRLRQESVRLENFHVDPVCTPTRAALMTGRYSIRTGAWAVTEGRQLLRRSEVTIAEIFAAGGYRTGIFGKWHLGDNFPYAPQYRGFQETVVLRGGGIGEIPDAWGNDYFDDRFWRNGQLEKFDGYCTDVFFREALRFIRAEARRPFFVYLPLNAMHSPQNVALRYSDRFLKLGIPEERAKFYGMIENFDENLGRLLTALEERQLARDTIVVFFGDNGTSVGGGRREGDGFNAGMRGNKGTVYEGGHRVTGFIRWPGQFAAGREVRELTTHRDVLPTLVELCGLTRPAGVKLDGASLVPLLRGETTGWPDRVAIVDRQADQLKKGAPFVVMRGPWRLVNDELYDLAADPGQKRNIANRQPDIVRQLRSDYDAWWSEISSGAGNEPAPFVVGAPKENPTEITARDWYPTDGRVPWRQESLGDDARLDNGCWYIEPARTGRYEVRVARFPDEAKQPMSAVQVRLTLDADEHVAQVAPDECSARFEVMFAAKQSVRLQTWIKDAVSGKERGAYFVTFRWVGQ